MRSRIRRPSLAMMVSLVALFLSLGGTTWAKTLIGSSQIKSSAVTAAKIAKNAVTNTKIAKNAVTSTKIKDHQVAAADLAANSVTGAALADGAVTSAKLGAGSVGATALSAGAVGANALAPGSVDSTALSSNAVVAGKVASNAITSNNVVDGSLTAGDLAPNTFLPANGTAADSAELGGVPASGYLEGKGFSFFNRLSVAAGTTETLLTFQGLGRLDVTCIAGQAQTQFVNEVGGVDIFFFESHFGAANTDVEHFQPPTAASLVGPAQQNVQAITWQAAITSGGSNHVVTAWTMSQDLLGTTCLVTGQALSTN